MTRVVVSVDPGRCVRSGTCLDMAPSSFDVTDNGVSRPVEAVIDYSDELDDAAQACPVRAIFIKPFEERGNTPRRSET